MIEILIVLIIIAFAIRRPRTYAEAQYRADMRRNNGDFAFFVIALAALVYVVGNFIQVIQQVQP